MGSFQPTIENLRVTATWNGDVSSPVSLEILIDVVAKSGSHLGLVQNDHPTVISSRITNISTLPRANESHSSISNFVFSEDQQHDEHPVDQQLLIGRSNKTETGQDSGWMNAATPVVPISSQNSSPITTSLPLASEPSYLSKPPSSRDSALSPPIPLTSKRLTITKRSSIEPDSLHASNLPAPSERNGGRKHDHSPQPVRRRPISLERRPPWRYGGFDHNTVRGRKQLAANLTKRRISRSMITHRASRPCARQRQSSLPSHFYEAERSLLKVAAVDGPDSAQTNPAEAGSTNPTHHHQYRSRDVTVKVIRNPDVLDSGERLKKWLEDRREEFPLDSPAPSEFFPYDDGCPPHLKLPRSSLLTLSPSPTPSSRAALPWATIQGIRGGGCSLGGNDSESSEEEPIPSVMVDNGTTLIFFRACGANNLKKFKFRIEMLVCVNLEPHSSGSHSLTIPGLPLQKGEARGIFELKILESGTNRDDIFQAHEKIAVVDGAFATHPLQRDQVTQNFSLEKPFQLLLLCFESCHFLEASDFEIDCDVHSRFEWEDMGGEGIVATHTLIASIRLRPFLMWAEKVKFHLYLTGGPSGSLETELDPGIRQIYIEGKSCDAGHELELSVGCPVADLRKIFTICWQQTLGTAPFGIYLPRISGLYRDTFKVGDPPQEAKIFVSPRRCQKSRRCSIDVRAHSSDSLERNLFDKTPSQDTIKKPGHMSGQLHDLAKGLHESEPRTRSKYDSVDCGYTFPPPVRAVIVSKPVTWTEAGPAKSLTHTIPDSTRRPSGTVALTECAADSMKLNSTRIAHTRAKSDRKSILAIFCATLRKLARVVEPTRILKTLIVVWLCLRAFEHEQTIQFESSIGLVFQNAWDRWDFEPVQLHGDNTGWKHLMAKIKQGKAKVLEHKEEDDPRADVENQVNPRPDKVAGKPDQSLVADGEEALDGCGGTEPGRPSAAGQPVEVPNVIETSSPKRERLSLRDRIDLYLGWRPPAGTFHE